MGRKIRGGTLALAAALCACRSDAAPRDTRAPDTSAAPPTAAAPAADTSGRQVLRADGIGPLRVGMTLAEAARALGGVSDTTKLERACDYVQPTAADLGVALMVEEGRVTRVDVRDSSRVATAAGIALGDSASRVRAAYPGARVLPHKYDEAGHYFVVIPGSPADTVHRLVIEELNGVVTALRGGAAPSVEYVEGCS